MLDMALSSIGGLGVVHLNHATVGRAIQLSKDLWVITTISILDNSQHLYSIIFVLWIAWFAALIAVAVPGLRAASNEGSCFGKEGDIRRVGRRSFSLFSAISGLAAQVLTQIKPWRRDIQASASLAWQPR
jgi:hypothetical protein